MPKITQVQTNFTGGELSPRLYGRVDIPRYGNSAKTLENVVVDHHGGASKRPGTRYVATTKTTGKRVRLINYIFNTTQAYVLEFGHLYMRVYRDGVQILSGGVPYEIVTNVTEFTLDEIHFKQSSDTMIICHESFLPQRLQRFADDYWIYDAVPFVVKPYGENGDRLVASLSIPDPTVGQSKAITSTPGVFLAADVGRTISAQNGGSAIITAYTSATDVVASIRVPFDAVSYLADEWVLEGSPQAGCTPSFKEPVGKTITLTLDTAGWRTTDDNKYVEISGGLVRITSYTSSTVVDGVIQRALTATSEAPKASWILNSPDWDDIAGYPRTCGFSKQRLFFAASPAHPQTFWASATGGYYDFLTGTLDTDAFSFAIADDQVNIISHLSQLQDVIIFTSGSEFTLTGTPEKGLTATNPQVNAQSVFGCSSVPPVRVGSELFFVQRAGKKLRAIAFTDTLSAYSANDMSVLSDHSIASGVYTMALQQEPISILWCVLNDGLVSSCTIEKEQDVVAWCRHDFGGTVESVTSVPSTTGNDVYISVLRDTARYIEQLSVDYYVDCGAILTSVTPTDTWTGLTHLINKTVDVLADGSPMLDLVVNGIGTLTLPRAASTVMVGLPYIAVIETLTPEAASSSGSIQSSRMRIGEATLRFFQTAGCRFNDNELAFRQLDQLDLLDNAVRVYSGDVTIELLGFETGRADLRIVQEQPLPMTVLAIIKKLTFND